MSLRKPIFGIGINDAGYAVQKQSIVNGKRTTVWVCPFFRVWMSMLVRCYSSNSHKTNPKYHDCSVSSEWFLFSRFAAWMAELDCENKELDKDILIPGNRIYGPDTCIFVDHALNKFTCDRSMHRGLYPIGTCFHKASKKFLASCNNPFNGNKEYLGIYNSPEQAHEAWRKKKHEHALAYAEIQEDQRIAEALRTRYLPEKEII